MLPTQSSLAHDGNVAVQALIKKTKSNLVFVKGGTFKMGDFGSISTPDKLPYTSQDESKPLHDVELESFSIGKYKVTYEDFDVYSSATGTPRIAELKRDETISNSSQCPCRRKLARS
ncbi:SUMF1/EgtB/PvdO family nonheme iron enzyme [Cupriavidus nantongensis]|uniref:SUMF1/EgtB/PvdO family nonheme iron enzyme n=1 Tax=Cupriavidus nantongensis TaxID=1796606 RepID=UPI003AAC5703